MLADGIERLADLQERLYAQRPLVGADRVAGDGRRRQGQRHQARDDRDQSAGLSRSIRSSSRAPRNSTTISSGARRQRLPERGRIGIFNRSHYEEVLVVRVHRELLRTEDCRQQLVGKDIWKERFEDIRTFEQHRRAQRHADPQILPHVSHDGAAQALPRPHRRAGQALEILHGRRRRAQALGPNTWPPMRRLIRETSRSKAPWYVVPADNKWFTRLVVAAAAGGGAGRTRAYIPRRSRARR